MDKTVVTDTTAAMTNAGLDHSRDSGHLDVTHYNIGSSLNKSKLLDITQESPEESRISKKQNEFDQSADGEIPQNLLTISANEYKQAGYTAMNDTL